MNKLLRSRARKLTSLVMLFTLGLLAPLSCLPAAASPEFEEEEAIHISTVQDLEEFSLNCTTDSWSTGKLFVLDNDIDLSGTSFTPVPTFGGTFRGQGHSIKGLSLEGGSNHTGLFRYIQESGEVYNLTVSGTANAKKNHSGLALLTGCNYGLISGCHSQGNITGGNQAAGIAGLNEVTGVITGCTADGVVYGNHVSGGIAGSNKGSILNSVNHSFVNTTASDNNIDLASIDVEAGLTNLLTTENAASVTDIGGIAGSNSGIIRGCTNDGSIGYQHVGYNIGGIAGSQTGYIEGCINYGLLNGRKDIGGIAGQMEPSSELTFSEDTLKKLDAEFDKLHDLLTQLNRDASSFSSKVTGQVDRLLNSVEGAQYAVDEIMNNAGQDITDFSNFTDLALLPSPRPVSLDFLDNLPKVSFSPWPVPSKTPEAGPSVTPGGPPENPDATPSRTPSEDPEPAASPSQTPAAVPTSSPAPTGSPVPTQTPDVIPDEDSEDIPDEAPGNVSEPDSETGSGEENGNIFDETSEDVDNQNTETVSGEDTGTDRDVSMEQESGEYTLETFSALPQRLPILRLGRISPISGTLLTTDMDSDSDNTPGTEDSTDSAEETLPSPEMPSPSPAYGEGTDTEPSPIPTPTQNPFTAGWMDGWPTPPNINFDNLQNSIDRENVERNINEAQQNVYQDASHVLESMQRTIQDQASILSSRIFAAQNSLNASFSAIVSDMRLLNSMLDEENQIILNDFQAIIDEFGVISDIITNPQTTVPDDILTDISDEDEITDTTGKVMNCINNGRINGDVNTGGIAGSLSRENNLDPEDDFDLDGNDFTLNFRYKERIVVRKCQNTGSVNGKKNHIGGIAGEMTLGSIIDCLNTGSITTDGDMAGGIAGYSASTIRQSSAKCTLSGNSQIGGIAGYATTVTECYSMVNIQNGETYLGSIAGRTDSSCTLKDNFFVQGCPAGVDGINYEGQAQAIGYEEFMKAPGLPDIFKSIYLTFTAEDKTVAVMTLEYGDTFRPEELPPVPEKEGCIGKWSDFPSDSITFDQHIEAIYSEYVSTIESPQTVGQRPVLLMEGRFSPEDTLILTGIDAYPGDAQTKSECWKISTTGVSTGPYRVRYLIPADMENPRIEIYENSTWVPVDTEKDGSYYVFTSEKTDLILSCVDRPASLSAGTIILLIICMLALITIFVILIKKKRTRKDKVSQ